MTSPTDQELLEEALLNKKGKSSIEYLALKFKSAKDFMLFFDPDLKSGRKTLHKWQENILDQVSEKGRYTKNDPLRLLLVAANGSGKDWCIIGGFVSYVLCCWKRYKVVITSASYLQLDTQTRTYIRYLCEQVNSYFKEMGIADEDVIDIKKETFKSKFFEKDDGSRYTLTGSECITFVTDEKGRAEGHHPFPDADDGEGVILIINEAKTVDQGIFEAFAKCTYNYWLEVSSPAGTSGPFYNHFCSATPWENGHVKGRYLGRRVTSYDCPHISPEKIEFDKQTMRPEFFKNTHLAEFSSVDQKVVVTDESIRKCLAFAREKIDIGLSRRAGLDIAGGRAECSFYVFDNNMQVGRENWKSKDTEETVDLLAGTEKYRGPNGEEWTRGGYFTKYGLKSENIYGDDNGLGQAVIDGLARRGWSIVRIRNQSPSMNKLRYANRGAELWFRLARLIEEAIIVLFPDDDKLFKQLANRHFFQGDSTGKLQLYSKEQELAEGNESPDRADALCLAFTGLTVQDFLDKDAKRTSVAPQGLPSSKALEEAMKHNQLQNKIGTHQFYDDLVPTLGQNKTINKRIRFSNPANVLHNIYGSN